MQSTDVVVPVATQSDVPTANNRIGPALVHMVQGVLFSVLVVVLAPVLILFLAVYSSPFISLGLCSSDDGVGLPNYWRRLRRLPYALPMVLFIDLPLTLFLWVYTCVAACLVVPAARVAFEARWALSPRATMVEEPPAPQKGDSRIGTRSPRGVQLVRAPDTEVGMPDTEAGMPDTEAGLRYREHESVWAALEGDGDKVKAGDVKLLSLRWLMALAEKGGALPRRQDLPEAAFIEAADLRQIEAGARSRFDLSGLEEAIRAIAKGGGLLALGTAVASVFRRRRNVDNLLPIVSVSYCWLEASHPDRNGKQLQLLSERLSSLKWASGARGRGFLAACLAYGFSDMGVFVDWGSGYQKDPALWLHWMADRALYELDDEELLRRKGPTDGAQMVAERRRYEASRSNEQTAAFHRMLHNTMDLWYAHAGITVVLMTQLPAELPSSFDMGRTYDQRGWTTFERCSAELAKSFKLRMAKWKLVIDVADEGGSAKRRLPTTPARMAELIAKCQFTNGADKEAVLELYQKTAVKVLASVESLDYRGLHLVRGDEWCSPSRLADALNHCNHLEILILGGVRLDDEGAFELAASLVDGALPALKALTIGTNLVGARGVRALCRAFSRRNAPSLRYLSFSYTRLGDAGATAFATALATDSMQPQLTLNLIGCDIGDKGAEALAAALSSAGSRVRVSCVLNRISLAGQSALLKALEKTHGAGFSHALAPVAFNGMLWPDSLSHAWRRGVRLANESGYALAC